MKGSSVKNLRRLADIDGNAMNADGNKDTGTARPNAVAVSTDIWERLARRRGGNLVKFFATSPLRGSALHNDRTKGTPRTRRVGKRFDNGGRRLAMHRFRQISTMSFGTQSMRKVLSLGTAYEVRTTVGTMLEAGPAIFCYKTSVSINIFRRFLAAACQATFCLPSNFMLGFRERYRPRRPRRTDERYLGRIWQELFSVGSGGCGPPQPNYPVISIGYGLFDSGDNQTIRLVEALWKQEGRKLRVISRHFFLP